MAEHNFLRWNPIFESTVGRSALIHEIVPKTVTLRQNPHFRITETACRDAPPWHLETMFHEVNMVPIKDVWSPAVGDFAKNPPKREQVDERTFLSQVCKIFEGVIEDAWIPERFHVVHQSGGFDTRLISWTLKKLYDKNGPEWLGDLLFIEFRDEQEEAVAALEAIGWGTSRYIKYMAESMGESTYESRDYFTRSCEFSGSWRRFNGGVQAGGFGWLYEPIEWLQEVGRIPSDDSQIQTFAGMMANELAHALLNKPGIEWALDTIRYHIGTFFIPKGELVIPYLSLDLTRAIYKYGVGHPEAPYNRDESKNIGYRRRILEELAPPEVGYVPKTHAPRRDFPWMSAHTREQMIRDYEGSWYGQNVVLDVKGGPPRGHGYHRWWGHFRLASFCEELRRRGHEIRRGDD